MSERGIPMFSIDKLGYYLGVLHIFQYKLNHEMNVLREKKTVN